MLTATTLFTMSNASPPQRLALIIGNGSYAFADPLPNAPADARSLAAKLKTLGFTVQANTLDLNKIKLAAAIADFGKRVRAAGPNVVSFFYFAGHAAQDTAGVNYLLPVDAKAGTPSEVRAVGTPMQLVLKALEDTNNSINIVVLDACRDWYKNDRTPQDPKGLHDMGVHASVVIAYATRAGDTADEGAELDSSPFSHRLIEAIDQQPGDPIVLLLDDVKSRVYHDTDASQFPLLVDGLTTSGRWTFRSDSLLTVPDTPHLASSPKPLSRFLAQLDRARLVTFFKGRESLADALLASREALQRFGLDTPRRLAPFLANNAFETLNFRFREEKFSYTAARLRDSIPLRVTSDKQAAELVGQPDRIADLIYANRMGNGPPESGDGWRFRGRGFAQLTGRANYKHYGDMIGVDLVTSPDLLTNSVIDFAIAAAIWSSMHANEAADTGDMRNVVRALAGIAPQNWVEAQASSQESYLVEARSALAIRP